MKDWFQNHDIAIIPSEKPNVFCYIDKVDVPHDCYVVNGPLFLGCNQIARELILSCFNCPHYSVIYVNIISDT